MTLLNLLSDKEIQVNPMPFKKFQIIYDWSYLRVHVHVALQIQQSFNHSLFMTPVFFPGFWEGHGVFWLTFLIVLVVSKKINLLWQAFLFCSTHLGLTVWVFHCELWYCLMSAGVSFLTPKGPFCLSVNFKMVAVRWNECIKGLNIFIQ